MTGIRVWLDGDRLIVAHRYGCCYDVIEIGNTGADVTRELSELPPGAREMVAGDTVEPLMCSECSACAWCYEDPECRCEFGRCHPSGCRP